MTTSYEFAYLLNVLSCAVLIARLAYLRLRHVYRMFSAYLMVALAAWAIFYVRLIFTSPLLSNYVVIWFGLQFLTWVVYVWMAYELLEAVLLRLPGILKFSRRLMFWMFGLATIISLLSAQNEYAVGGVRGLEGVGLVLDRAISSTVLIVLLAVLGFLFRFPVEIPRNLAAFSLSFVFFFGFNTVVDLARAYLSHSQGSGVNVDRFQLLSLIGVWLQTMCFLFLSCFLSKAGEKVPVSLRAQPAFKDRERLMGQLEALNTQLLRAARR
ncbi:MAG TPA: hypothetical protein VHZ07_06595 [Bryobacteraceae bacterium]|jgi:hypothetical protein|nr:hypothetical protein [Bryobacteraceae bacterium]